jgi:hypothetical protein
VQMYSTESHSFRGLVRLAITNPSALFVALVIGLAFATWAAWRVWRASDDTRLRWAALTLAMLFSSPHLLTYDLLLLAVPLILIVDWRIQPDVKAPLMWGRGFSPATGGASELTRDDSCGGGPSGPPAPRVAGLKPRIHGSGAERPAAWRVAIVLLYIGAWPGTLLAKMYGVQASTIGMGLALWLLAIYLRRSGASTVTATSSSMSPIISS